MRIVCQCDGYLPDVIGGMEVLSARLFAELRRRGHELLVLTSCKSGREAGPATVEGIPVVRLDFWKALQSNDVGEIGRLLRDVNAVIADFRPDVMHLNDTLPSGFFFFRRGATRSIPRVLALHSPFRAEGELQHRLVGDADVIVAVSQSLAGDAARAAPAIAPKLTVVRNALPLPERAPRSLPPGVPLFLCISRLARDKGIDVAVEAMALLRAKGIEARLRVFGSGQELQALNDLAAARGVTDCVEFRRWLPPSDVPDAISEARAIVVPSRWREPFGLVALEAAQMGRPVIASRIGGLTEIVDDGRSGLLVSPDDREALAQAMTILALSPARAAELGDNARGIAERGFDFAEFVSGYERVYARAVSAIGSGRAVA